MVGEELNAEDEGLLGNQEEEGDMIEVGEEDRADEDLLDDVDLGGDEDPILQFRLIQRQTAADDDGD